MSNTFLTATGTLGAFFPSWVRQLPLHSIRTNGAKTCATLTCGEEFTHGYNIVCGQALFAAADSLMVCAMSDLSGVTGTVGSTMSFMKPVVPNKEVALEATVLKAGRTLVFGEVLFSQKETVVAKATFTFGRQPS